MKRVNIGLFLIGFVFLIISIFYYYQSNVNAPNRETVWAVLIDYEYIEDVDNYDERVGGWHGIYKFTVNNKDYSFTGGVECNPKSIVPESVKVSYNIDNPSEFKEETPKFVIYMTGGVGIICLLLSFFIKKKNYNRLFN